MIQRFGQSVTVTRYGAGSNVNGDYVAGTATTFAVIMSVQPLSGRELLNLPEGQRTRNILKGYCATELYTATQAESKKADVVTVGSKSYEVQFVEHWQEQGGDLDPFWKVHMAEENP